MRKIRGVISLIALAFTLAYAQATTAQQPREQPDMTIDAATRAEIIDGVSKKLNDAYVFPEVAKKMEQAIREWVQKKEYDGVTSASKFAQTLTTHLQEVSHDKHLRVNYSHDPIPPETARREPTPEERERFHTFMKTINFGFEKVERHDECIENARQIKFWRMTGWNVFRIEQIFHAVRDAVQRTAIFAGGDLGIGGLRAGEGVIFGQRDDRSDLWIQPFDATEIDIRKSLGSKLPRLDPSGQLRHGCERDVVVG